MDAIQTLKQQAARKRDAAIQAARDEYRRTVSQIEAVGLRLSYDVRTTRGTSRKRFIYELIIEYMPKDRPFAMRDILPILRKAEPGRRFIEPTIRTMFKRLIDQGLVKKVRKGNHGFMLWAAPDCPIDDHGPLATVSIADAIDYVLEQKGPLRPVEIILAVQQYGYRADASPRALLPTLTQALKRNGHRFVCGDDGKWSAV